MDLSQSATSPINCLIVVASLIRAGAETQAVNLANGLAARGHSVHLCSFEPQLDQRDRLVDEVHFHHIPRRSKYDLTLVSRLAELIDIEKIEVALGVLQFATFVTSLASKKSVSGPPVIAAVHTTINRGMKQEILDQLVYRNMLRRLPAVVFVCENQQEHWLRKFPELKRNSRVVHNGVEPELFRSEEFSALGRALRNKLEIPDSACVFSCIAAFRPEKGQKLLLDAFQSVYEESYLVFAGDGQVRKDIEEYAAATGVVSKTRFLGNISDTRPLIAASNATVLASTAVETFSMAMLESMAMGVPMIAPRIGGLPEAIIPDSTGMLFPVGDSIALANCMRSIVQDPSHTVCMGNQAKEMVVDNFTFDKMVAKTEGVMVDVLYRS